MSIAVAFLFLIGFYFAFDKASKRDDDLFFSTLFTTVCIAIGYLALYFIFAWTIFTFIGSELESKTLIKLIFWGFLGALAIQRITIPYIFDKGFASYRQIKIGLQISAILTALTFFIIEEVAGKSVDSLFEGAPVRNYFIFSTIFYLISAVIASIYEDVEYREMPNKSLKQDK